MYLRRVVSTRCFSSHTIFSKSSGSGKCGVAVVRVSGDNSKEALKALTGTEHYKPRYATLKQIRDPVSSALIDNGLVLYFPGPKSFTGEDSCEFQVHGGPAVVSAVLSALSKVKGLRPADPGEFTKRAFFNGKMDLTEVEGLADLIHAETELQRKQALIQVEGHLSKLYVKWRTRLIRCIAHLEAFIDFSEDENIEDDVLEVTQKELLAISEELRDHLKEGRKGERLRDGVKLAILGQTNVGKSSLMNILIQRDVSIISEVAGTTRDIIETAYDISGYPVLIADTAGLRNSEDIVEAEGMSRARKYAKNCDLAVLLFDALKLEKYFNGRTIDFDEYERVYLEQLGLTDIDPNKILRLVNKTDLLGQKTSEDLKASAVVGISCLNQTNIKEAIEIITTRLRVLCGEPSAESPVLSNSRHRHYLQECLGSIETFLENFEPSREQDFAILVQDLRSAVRSVGRITGEIRTDDVLDVIFKDFCIGK